MSTYKHDQALTFTAQRSTLVVRIVINRRYSRYNFFNSYSLWTVRIKIFITIYNP